MMFMLTVCRAFHRTATRQFCLQDFLNAGLGIVFAMILVAANASFSVASLTGDVELLRTMAVKYRENFDRIETWRGRLTMVRSYVDDGIEGRIECAIRFAYDANRQRWHHKIEVTKDVETVDGKERARMELEVRNGIFRDGAYYRTVYPPDKENDIRIAVVQSERFMEPGFSYATFEPMYFMTNEGKEWDKRWLIYFEHRDDSALEGSVKRNGDKVIFTRERESPENRLLAVHEIDLALGGNVVLRKVTRTEMESEITFVYDWEWQEVNGVFVPRKVTKDYVRTGNSPDKYRVTLQWEENIVNEQLPPGEFSLAQLGLRQGDWVEDTRTNTEYVIEGPECPPNPASGPDVAPRRSWLSTPVVVIVLIIIVLALVLYSRIHRYQQTS